MTTTTTTKEFNKILREWIKIRYAFMSFAVRKATTSKKPNPYITIFSLSGTGIIPNDIRKEIINIVFPDAKVMDWNNISYGNFLSTSITIRENEWKKVIDFWKKELTGGK